MANYGEVNEIILKTLGPYLNGFANDFMESFDKEVELRMVSGRSGNSAVMKEFYNDYKPLTYRRTYNLFNNVYKTKVNKTSASHKMYFNKEMEISFSGGYLKPYRSTSGRDVRNAVFSLTFLEGYHGSPIFFKNREVPRLSPPPVERAEKYIKDSFYKLVEKYKPRFRKILDTPIKGMFADIIENFTEGLTRTK